MPHKSACWHDGRREKEMGMNAMVKWGMALLMGSVLVATLVVLSGCQAYTHWLSTEVVGCDPALLKQGVCAPRTAQGTRP
jgi:hypothetical protein